MFSDSSSGRNGSSHDRIDYNSACTSYIGSSGTESGNWDRERWRSGAGPVIRETKLGGVSYQLICADGNMDGATKDGAASGAGDGGCDGGDGDAGGSDTILAEAGENGEEGGGEGDSEDDTSSSDGMGETASVADITDCLDCIGDVSESAFRLSPLVTNKTIILGRCLILS